MTLRSVTQIANTTDFTDTFTAEYDQDQTTATLITPTSGKLLSVVGVKISTEGATATDDKIRVFFNTTGDTVTTCYPGTSPVSFETGPISIKGAKDEVLSITSDLGAYANYFISVNYREE